CLMFVFFFFSSRRRHTRWPRDWSSDVCSSDLPVAAIGGLGLVGAVLLDPSVYRRYWRGLYGGTIALMILVILAAPLTRGSKRWRSEERRVGKEGRAGGARWA